MNYSLLTIHKVIPGLISSSIVLTWKVVVGRVSERGEREMLFFFFLRGEKQPSSTERHFELKESR